MDSTLENRSLWDSGSAKILRWLFFLPIGFLLAGILQMLPPLAVEWARGFRPEISFLTIVLAVIAVSILGTVCWLWFAAVVMSPVLASRIIAPHRKIAAVIFGTLFCLFQALFVLRVFLEGGSWVYLGYQLLFAGLTIAGIIVAYKDDDE